MTTSKRAASATKGKPKARGSTAIAKGAGAKGAGAKGAGAKGVKAANATKATRAPRPAAEADRTPAPRRSGERRCWLVKSEPNAFSFDDLWRAPDRTTCWDGVRNYQARNFMRDEMRVGDPVLFYHSSAEPPAVAGVAEVVREGYPDETAFDRDDSHYDPKSRRESPTWYMVDLRAVERFEAPVTLATLRETPGLEGMALLQRGSRLSVQPVRPGEWELVVALGRKAPNAGR